LHPEWLLPMMKLKSKSSSWSNRTFLNPFDDNRMRKTAIDIACNWFADPYHIDHMSDHWWSSVSLVCNLFHCSIPMTLKFIGGSPNDSAHDFFSLSLGNVMNRWLRYSWHRLKDLSTRERIVNTMKPSKVGRVTDESVCTGLGSRPPSSKISRAISKSLD
jgi:hypothetical protein